MGWLQCSPNLFFAKIPVSGKNGWLIKVCFQKKNLCLTKFFFRKKSYAHKSFFSKVCRRGGAGTEREPKAGVEWRRPRADKPSKIKPFVSRTFFLKTKPLLNNFFFLKNKLLWANRFSAHWDLCKKKDLVRNRSTNLFSVHVFLEVH